MQQYRFDDHLSHLQASDLKSMMRLWGGRTQARKDECIAIIRQGLADPERVRAAIAGLSALERTALAIVKKMGGSVESVALAAAIRAAGVHVPAERHRSRDDTRVLIEPLIRRGLLLSGPSAYAGVSWGSSRGGSLFSDERLLAEAGPIEYVPVVIPPSPPTSSTFRRPPAVLLDVVGILQAIDTLGGLILTKAGVPRSGDVRRLAKAMGWKEEEIAPDGLPFPAPAQGWIAALRAASLLSVQGGDTLGLRTPIDHFATQSYAQQVDTLVYGFVAAHGWSERPAPLWYGGEAPQVGARLALLMMLGSLPVDSDEFVAIDAFDQALYNRIGEHFSLRYLLNPPFFYNKSSEEMRREEAEWREKVRASWLDIERPWLQAALSSWLYMLGMVEIGSVNGRAASVRLTELGRAVLHRLPDQTVEEPARPRLAWLVQPNFDVQVFLDQITPEQLAFLERHAERVQAHQHTAEYRITRESVYRGLESGTSLDALLAGLQDGMGTVLPQNVEVELRSWAGLREQVRLRRRARLVEYPDARQRQAALAGGIPGTALGDRFVLLDPGARPTDAITTRLDYADVLPPCLSVTEEGVVKIVKETGDLLTRRQLERWAEPVGEDAWRLTAASVGARIKAGGRANELTGMLKERLTHPVPPLLSIALQAWTGAKRSVEVAAVTVLRCRQPAVLDAIAESTLLRPFILATLAPDLLLVDTRRAKALRERLQWAGLDVADVLTE